MIYSKHHCLYFLLNFFYLYTERAWKWPLHPNSKQKVKQAKKSTAPLGFMAVEAQVLPQDESSSGAKSSPGGSDHKEFACDVGYPGSIPGSGRFPGEGIPTSVFLPENPMDRGAWWVVSMGQKHCSRNEGCLWWFFRWRDMAKEKSLSLRVCQQKPPTMKSKENKDWKRPECSKTIG